MATTDDRPTLQVTREIPIPSSISSEAQEFLAAGGKFVRSDMTGAFPALDDAEGWRAVIAATDAMLAASFEARAESTPATVDARAVDGVDIFVVHPDGAAASDDAAVLLDIHGGGLIMGAGLACRGMAISSAARAALLTWSVDYRMPPDHPYPAALDDCMTVYRALLRDHPPERIVVGGGSAGGNLAAALVLRARDEGLPLPAALLLFSPEVDLTESGDTFAANLGVDTVLTSGLGVQNLLYAGGADLAHPYLSPLFGDLSMPFPPTLIQAGTRDLFLSNAVRMHRGLRAGGVDAELHVFEAMPHGGFGPSPEEDDLTAEVRRFIARHVAAA